MKEKFTANAKLHNSNPNPNPNIVKWSVLYLTNYACFNNFRLWINQ